MTYHCRRYQADLKVDSCCTASRATALNPSTVTFPFFALCMSFSATCFRLSWSPPWGTPLKISSSTASMFRVVRSSIFAIRHLSRGISSLTLVEHTRAELRLSIQRRFRLAHTLVLSSGDRANLYLNAPASSAVPGRQHSSPVARVARAQIFQRHPRRSIRRRLALSLQLCRFYPPHQVVGKARKRPFESLAAFTRRRPVGRQRLCNGTYGNRA
jgi:hypothetical protein